MVRVAPPTHPDATLDVIVQELTRVARPELVLLFGSRASGTPRADSDYDLMVVFADGADLARERKTCATALSESNVSADVLVRTVSAYRRHQHDAGYLDWLVAREGKVLFATGTVAQRDFAPRVRENPDGVSLWRDRAAADLREAELSAASGTPVPDAICFHAHAAIEKLLKARIALRGTFPKRTHDLESLLKAQPLEIRDDRELAAACTILQQLYPRSRYPEEEMPSVAEALEALDAAHRARVRLDALPE